MRTKHSLGLAMLGFVIVMTPCANTNSTFSAESNLVFSTESEKANASITPLPGIPQDFELVYGAGATHADWGSTKYTISADGSAAMKRTKHIREKDQNPEIKQCQLTAEELGGIWKEIQKDKFLKLKENYTNPHIMDGSSNFIYVKANGKEHTVSVINTKVKAFDRIAKYVENIFDKKVAK